MKDLFPYTINFGRDFSRKLSPINDGQISEEEKGEKILHKWKSHTNNHY